MGEGDGESGKLEIVQLFPNLQGISLFVDTMIPTGHRPATVNSLGSSSKNFLLYAIKLSSGPTCLQSAPIQSPTPSGHSSCMPLYLAEVPILQR